jgi:glutaconate CoA-transferase subunit B
MSDYTPSEMMIVTAARALAGVRTVLVGVGLPNIACNLARRVVEPNLELIYESGVFGAQPARLPLSIGDPALVSGAQMACSMADLFMLYLQGGRVDVAFLGTAQIDRFGNLNTTVIGDYAHPRVRLPGSGGACEIAINAHRVFIISPLERRTFVERLDFRTTPGHLNRRAHRRALGIPGHGPEIVVTDMAVFRFESDTREMTLSSLHPGCAVNDIQARVGWPLRLAPKLSQTEPPTPEELYLIREELNPPGFRS